MLNETCVMTEYFWYLHKYQYQSTISNIKYQQKISSFPFVTAEVTKSMKEHWRRSGHALVDGFREALDLVFFLTNTHTHIPR